MREKKAKKKENERTRREERQKGKTVSEMDRGRIKEEKGMKTIR